MNKHSTGPWNIGDKVRRFIYAADDTPICECDSIGETSKATEIANARLISAAPELLDALETLCNRIELESATPLDWPSYKHARDAIAKATGAT